MGVLPSSAVRRKGMRARRWVPVLVAFVSLAVAPIVRADPGGTIDTVEPAASNGGSPAGHGGDPGAAKDPQANAAAAPEDTADRPASAADGTDGPGNSEKSSESSDGGAPGSADNPSHADDGPAPADAEHRGNVDQGASVDQKADAAASAGQRNVDNTAVEVRIDDPGNGKKIGQENLSAAAADASVSTVGDTAGSTTVQQEAGADAGAAQSAVSNTAVVVRVGSAGDDEGVTQLEPRDGKRDGERDVGRPRVRIRKCGGQRHPGRRQQHERPRPCLLAR